MQHAIETKQAQFRLPMWVWNFVEQRSRERRETKTKVIIEAVTCLQQREIEELMAEGYAARATESARVAESMLPGGVETLPEW